MGDFERFDQVKMADIEWFYVDTGGNQNGPVGMNELKSAWSAARLNESCLVWNGNMSGWQAVAELPDLKTQLNPPKATPAPAPAALPRPVASGGGMDLQAAIAARAAKMNGLSLTTPGSLCISRPDNLQALSHCFLCLAGF